MLKRCNKKQANKLRSLKIRNDDIYELLEETLRRDKFDTKFWIVDGVDNNKDTNEEWEGKVV